MHVAMLGENLYQYDFEPVGSYDPTEDPLGVSQDAGTRYANFQYMGAVQDTGFSLNIPSVADFEKSVASKIASDPTIQSTEAQRKAEAEKDARFRRVLEGVSSVTGALTSSAKELIPFLTDRQKAMVQDEMITKRSWWARNQAWLIIGGTAAAAILIVGMTAARRKRRR